MKDLREKLENLRADAAEFALMSRRANDAEKRERFARLADEIAIEALELEQILGRQSVRSGPVIEPDSASIDRHNVVPLEVRSKP
ncbi:hypothetical protein [Bradyrhizobium sp. UFLA05-112]